MNFGIQTRGSKYDLQLTGEIFRKQKLGTTSNLEYYEAKKNIRNYVGECKNLTKKEKKGFYGNSKNIFTKNIFITTNSSPNSSKNKFILHPSSVQLNNTTKANIVTTETFDDD